MQLNSQTLKKISLILLIITSLFFIGDIRKSSSFNNNNFNNLKNTKLGDIPSQNLVYYFNEYLQSILLLFSYSEKSDETDNKLNFWANDTTVGESYNNLLSFENDNLTTIYYDYFLSNIWTNVLEDNVKNIFHNFIKFSPDPDGGKVASLPFDINGLNNVFPNYIDFKITDNVKENTLSDFFNSFNSSFFNFYIKNSIATSTLKQSVYQLVTKNAINKLDENSWWNNINNDLLPSIETILLNNKPDSIFNSLICSDMFNNSITVSTDQFRIENLNIIHNLNNIWLSLEQFIMSGGIDQNSNLLSMYLIGINNENEPNQVSFWTENNLNNFIGDPINNSQFWDVDLKGKDTDFNSFVNWIFNKLQNKIQTEFLISFIKINPFYNLSDNINSLIQQIQNTLNNNLSPIYNQIIHSLEKVDTSFKLNQDLINSINLYNTMLINDIQSYERSLILTINDIYEEKTNREEIDKNARLINKFIDDFQNGLLKNTNRFYPNQDLLVNTQFINNFADDYNNFLTTLSGIFDSNNVINNNNLLWVLWIFIGMIGICSITYVVFFMYKKNQPNKSK
ncbi:hypothetical protein ASO20_00225 [Mycoplasma sp. (ex Biomphalaria glabrata)]|uniref:hypothetical protein n=1 Tax=Mycoplasma sp. (ex Biomphalaria glabrata) TaxID=1749074 RepID=UPI00073A7D4A|nr:hypothetical protein [Mycoplasma sp. (ex Biomphalaria glabrata)]ALV23107.1 hypothetical protein ASO20_00225 [Mycoplasma sp. (ex Biomphalaria glabrata)]